METRMTEFPLAERKTNARNNTALAFDSKFLEWKQFCECQCPNDEFKTLATQEKAHNSCSAWHFASNTRKEEGTVASITDSVCFH